MNNSSDEEWAYIQTINFEAQVIVAEWDFEMFDLTGCLDSGLI